MVVLVIGGAYVGKDGLAKARAVSFEAYDVSSVMWRSRR